MKIRLRLGVRLRELPCRSAEDIPFRTIATGRVPRFGMLISSVAIHIVAIVLIAAVSQLMYFKDEEIDWTRYRMEPLRLRLAQPLYFRASAQETAPAAVPPRRPGSSSGKTLVAPGSGRRFIPPGLELPAPAEAA